MPGVVQTGRFQQQKGAPIVRATFEILQDLRDRGMSILMVEQNARSALQISDHAIVLELGRTRITGPADAILADPRVGQLFLGAGLGSTPEEAAPSGAGARRGAPPTPSRRLIAARGNR
jgi:ABC-type sugar transport system ATPase subunit